MWRSAFLYLSTNSFVRSVASSNPLARSFASRFVAGETLGDAIRVARDLGSSGSAVEFDCLGENVTDSRMAEAARDTYLQLLDQLGQSRIEGHVSVKLTQMGLDIDESLCLANLEAIATRAEAVGSVLWVDMEGSLYTDRTIEMYDRLRASHANTGIALQTYLYRTEADLRHILSIGGLVRLCKGAYLEPPSVAYPLKADVDRNYLELTGLLLKSNSYQALATHDPKMIEGALRVARANGISRDSFEFQMLHGVRRDLQDRLVAEGHRLRVYVPYGTEWYPYFMRRLAERPANLFFLLGNLLRDRGRPQRSRKSQPVGGPANPPREPVGAGKG